MIKAYILCQEPLENPTHQFFDTWNGVIIPLLTRLKEKNECIIKEWQIIILDQFVINWMKDLV